MCDHTIVTNGCTDCKAHRKGHDVEPGATTEQVTELANAIAQVAEAIANGTVIGPVHAAVRRLASNVALLQAWVPDDRS